jgi:site-specific recombinase XerD
MRPVLKFVIPSFAELTYSVSAYMRLHFLRSEVTIRNYHWIWRKLERYMLDNMINDYEPTVGKAFLISRFGLNCDYRKLTTPEKCFVRSIKILSEYCETKTIKPLKQPVSFSGNIGLLMQDYVNNYRQRRLVPETVDRCERVLYHFFCYLKSNNVEKVKDITQSHVLLYLKSLDAQIKSFVQNTLSTLKYFFVYLYDSGHTNINLSGIIPRNNIKGQPKLPSTYTKDEIEKLLKSIDRGCDLGKRNYAILLLACRLGLRASDICMLKFENIHWEKNLFTINQQKTGKNTELPLLSGIGNAIIDYLKYARPKSTEPFVFLRVKAPFTRLYGTAITAIVHNSLVHAGVNIENKRHGAHSLRHSLAGILLGQKTILPVISEVLGHGNVESTKYYLRIDLANLNQCSLEVPPVSQAFYTQKGGIFYD